MKIFLSYKQTGLSIIELKKNLNYIKDIIEKSGNEIYIYLFDEERKNNSKFIIKKIKDKIKQSDLVLGFVEYSDISEGQLIELGIAEGLNKDILLIVNQKCKDDYYLLYGLNGKIIYYKNLSEIEALLINYNKGK